MAAVLAVALLLLCGNVQSADASLVGYVTQVKTEESKTSSTTPAMAPAITSPTEGSGDTHTAVLSALPQNEKGYFVPVDLARADDENMLSMTSAPAPSPPAEAVPEGFDMIEAEAPSTVEEAPGPVASGPDSADPAAPGPDSAYSHADSGEGKLISRPEDTNYPNLRGVEDNSNGDGYGVQSTGVGADPQGDVFTTYDQNSPDPSGEGKLISRPEDTNYPNLKGVEDNSNGDGYGVQSTGVGADPQGDVFTTYDQNSPDPSGEGKLISRPEDTNYPNLKGVEDNSNGDGYGIQSTGVGADPQGDVFTTYDQNSPDPSGEGKLISRPEDTNYPNLKGVEDNSNGDGYGVQSTGVGADPQGDVFTTYDQNSTDTSGEGKLISNPENTNYPLIKETQDFAGYGVNNPGGEGDEYAATTQDEGGLESGKSETTGVTLSQSRTYTPPPKSKATWGNGKCTFYGGMDAAGTMSGACGYGNLYASGYGAYTTALSSALFKNGMACGACFEVACSGNPKACNPGSVLVTVTNFCPPNPGQSANSGGWCNGANQHFDLSYPAFAKIADPKTGVVDLKYRRVPCKKTGGIRFTLNGNCNFNLVTITNVGGSGVVTAAYMKGDGMDWAPMSRNWGANWQCSRNYCGKGISIKIVTSDKKVSVSKLAGKNWAFGKTYIGQQVY